MNLSKKVTTLIATLSIFALTSCDASSPFEPKWNPTNEKEIIDAETAIKFATDSGFPLTEEESEIRFIKPKTIIAKWDFSKSKSNNPEQLLQRIQYAIISRTYPRIDSIEDLNRIGIKGTMHNTDYDISTTGITRDYLPISVEEINETKDKTTFYLHKNTNLTFKISDNNDVATATLNKQGFMLFQHVICNEVDVDGAFIGEIKVAYTI